jgi:2-haloacid dehalogenase
MHANDSEKPVIVLDAGKVLVDFDVTVLLEELSARIGAAVGFPLPPHLEAVFSESERSGPAWRAIPAAVNAALGLDLSAAQWGELWCRIFTGEVPGMRAALEELMADFRLVALSNTCQVHWEHVCGTYPIFRLLDGWVVSYDEGVAKPDPEIYRAVMHRHTGGRAPFFFTDDNPRFVEAARRLGWDAEEFAGADAFRAAIERRRDPG